MASLDNMAPRTADVYRGSEMTTWAEEVVVGDTVFLRVRDRCIMLQNSLKMGPLILHVSTSSGVSVRAHK